ncbi:hypothetical protein [Streptomyces torulosus]|uniref:hypothetical protein n=1 Tax=Streptomyces torulosus TaxID=68276 RepID=UPI0006EB6AF9|nr:hypothetical protein [Streptomyces torulosus]
MIHEIEDLEQEIDRLTRQPSQGEVPPVLCAFDVVTTGPVDEYVSRVRSVLHAALTLAISQSFEGDDLPTGDLPEWFVAASEDAAEPVPDFAARGRDRYVAMIKGTVGRGWQLQEWLYQFDPDSEFRGWAWWDVTYSVEGHVRIWVDSWGESFFACDELRWLAYTAGGQEVSGPVLLDSTTWVSAAR